MENATMDSEHDEQREAVDQTDPSPDPHPSPPPSAKPLSKSAQKKLLKQQRFEAKKAEKKSAMKEQRKSELERKRKEWEEKLSSLSEEDRLKIVESRREMRRQRMEQRSLERENKIERLIAARTSGQKIVIDLEFSDLMAANEIHSLVQQIMYCYAVNARCPSPAHLWLTSCQGELGNQLQRLPGFDKWIIEKESRPYIEIFEHQKKDLVYLTADSEIMLDELDPKKMYIIGGLVDRNRWKGITMKKAGEQGIQTAKLPIGNFLKMSSSQVLTVNQVIEILLKFLETRDWKASFFHMIPQRKRCKTDSEICQQDPNKDESGEDSGQEIKRQCVET